jgi:D-hydroxyproline dehydrogenase subunit beta
MAKTYDFLIIGAGIVGLAHAYEAHKRGYTVAVVERNAKATGASIRNFGFITVSGQRQGETWRRALHSSKIWSELAPQANIPIIHRGSYVLCQRPEAEDVALAFLETEMGEACQYYTKNQLLSASSPIVDADTVFKLDNSQGILFSPHDLRVESREALPLLAKFLEEKCGIDFHWNKQVLGIDDGEICTSEGNFFAHHTIICTGAEISGIAKSALKAHDLSLCTLQMLRIKPPSGFKLPGSVMTDNSLARYSGWAILAAANPLKAKIMQEMPEYIKEGIHLICVQSADGSLVVGDSHVYASHEDVFARQEVDKLIISLMEKTLNLKNCPILERWTGVYLSSPHHDAVIEDYGTAVKVVVVTSGTGASTAFGIAQDTFNQWNK